MKVNRVVVLFAVCVSFATLVRAEDESLASIFTNTASAHHTVVPRRPSIILIACHDLALGDLSCYGQTNFQTPNLDRLAAEGTRFTNYRAAGDDFTAAQAALMEGNNTASAAGEPTVATRLLQVGYHTGLIGEWELGPQPWTQGFQEFTGFLNEDEGRNYYSGYLWRYAPNFLHDPAGQETPTVVRREQFYNNTGANIERYMPDLFQTAMGNFIRVNQPDFANHFQPFFLMFSLSAPESATPGRDNYPVPTDAPFTGENWPQPAKNRAALMTRLDDGVGRLLQQLKQLGMTNNVAIFLTGTAAPAPFANTNLNFLKAPGEVRGGKSGERLRVPMIVRWPEHVPAGRVSDLPWSAQDFAPTVLEIGYGRPGQNFTGKSILPQLIAAPTAHAPAAPARPDHAGQP